MPFSALASLGEARDELLALQVDLQNLQARQEAALRRLEQAISALSLAPTSRASTRHPPFAGLKAKTYYVITAGGERNGIFSDYPIYAEAARAPGVYWAGRGKIPFRAGCASLSFKSLEEAERHWVASTHSEPIFIESFADLKGA